MFFILNQVHGGNEVLLPDFKLIIKFKIYHCVRKRLAVLLGLSLCFFTHVKLLRHIQTDWRRLLKIKRLMNLYIFMEIFI